MIYTNKKVFFYTKIRFASKILKIIGVMILRQFMSIRCQLLSIQGTYFVWVGRATSRWQPKTKMMIYQTMTTM